MKNINHMGAEIIGASILGGASLFGTAATVATNDSNQDFSADQSEEARKWSTNERLAAQEYNTKEREATQEYNSVANQAMQYRASGLNPNALGNAVGFKASTPQSSSPASAPMSGIGTSVVPNIPQLISSGADLVNALSKHKETQATLPLINEQVKNYMLQNFGQDTTNKILDLEKQLKQATLPAEIKTKFEELAKLGFDKLVSEQQGKKFEQETRLLKQQEEINRVLKDLKGQELIQAQYLTQRWNEIQDSVVSLNKAKAGEAKASAANQYSQASLNSSVKALTDAKTDREKVQALGDVIDNGIKSGVFTLQQLGMSKAELEKLQTDYYLDNLKDSRVSMYMDNLFHRVKDYLPNLPIGLLFGK